MQPFPLAGAVLAAALLLAALALAGCSEHPNAEHQVRGVYPKMLAARFAKKFPGAADLGTRTTGEDEAPAGSPVAMWRRDLKDDPLFDAIYYEFYNGEMSMSLAEVKEGSRIEDVAAELNKALPMWPLKPVGDDCWMNERFFVYYAALWKSTEEEPQLIRLPGEAKPVELKPGRWLLKFGDSRQGF